MKVRCIQEFSVDGYNWVKKLNRKLKEAMLGTDKSINTLDNRGIKLHIKSGTQSGTKLRIPESGLPRKVKSNGDLLVDIRVKIPALVESDLEKTFAEVLNENTK